MRVYCVGTTEYFAPNSPVWTLQSIRSQRPSQSTGLVQIYPLQAHQFVSCGFKSIPNYSSSLICPLRTRQLLVGLFDLHVCPQSYKLHTPSCLINLLHTCMPPSEVLQTVFFSALSASLFRILLSHETCRII